MLIYQAKNLKNKHIYIGQTINSFEDRIKKHLSATKTICNTYFSRAIKKYGEENFEWSILEDNISHINKMNWFEKFCIAYYDTLAPNGYNLESGGENYSVSDDTRKKMSKSAKKRKRLPVSDKTRKAISEANKGRIFSNNHCKNLSEAGKGRIQSKDHKRKNSEANMGEKNGMSKGCFIMGVRYGSLSEASRELKITGYYIGVRLKDPNNKNYQYI